MSFFSYTFSVTKQHANVHEYVATETLSTQVHNRSTKKSASNNNDIVMDANPAYVEGFLNDNRAPEAGDDGEYEIVENPFRQAKAVDIVLKNPGYDETMFT